MSDIKSDAYAVLFPAIDGVSISNRLVQFLEEGGRSILLGETRGEYLSRRMSDDRRKTENNDTFQALTEKITRHAGPSLIALDQEPAGILRLHDLVPHFPELEELHTISDEQIEDAAFKMAASAKKMGINMFLSPIVDVIVGNNPWLLGRTLGKQHVEVARIASAFIRGTEAAGVVATAKHFPGHHDIDGDPAVEMASVLGGDSDLEKGMPPFREAISAGVRAIMTGPALVPALDPNFPSSLSLVTIKALRKLGFTGLIVSDDLDAVGTLRDKLDVPSAAVAALKAGSDLLLLSAQNDLTQVRTMICNAVAEGVLPRERLAEAAKKVRSLASDTKLKS